MIVTGEMSLVPGVDQQHSSGPALGLALTLSRGCAAANSGNGWQCDGSGNVTDSLPTAGLSNQPRASDQPGPEICPAARSSGEAGVSSQEQSYSSAVADDKPAVTSEWDMEGLSLYKLLLNFQNLQQTCITCWASPKMYFSTSLCSISFFCR